MLLLDEPTNHLDAESVAWLEIFLADFPGTVVAITHDRYFLDNITKWILELENGKGTPYEGNYSGWLEQKINKRLVSRLFFVELKSINSVLDTLNNCFYQIDENGDYDIDTEYRLEDVSDEWWEKLSLSELEIVNKIK